MTDRADDREEIGAGLDERPAILPRDAADRAAGHHHRLAPVTQQFRVGAVLGRRLGRAREEGARGGIIDAGLDDAKAAASSSCSPCWPALRAKAR
jgi:hypothetical protein